MSDVLFRYLLRAREPPVSWHQRAFLTDERLIASRLEKIVETAAVRVEVCTQLARISTTNVSVPASKWNEVRFVDTPVQNPPVAPKLEDRTDRFPLRSTLQMQNCFPCNGTGQLSCKECKGKGIFICKECNGRGYHTNRELERVPCAACKGVGEGPCTRCDSKGVLVHDACGGEGRVATWDEELHIYTVSREGETFLPEGAPPEAAAPTEVWFKEHPGDLPDLSFPVVAGDLGYATNELAAVVKRAQLRKAGFERSASAWDESALFSATACRAMPMSACVFAGDDRRRPHQFWLVGRGVEAVELLPAPHVDVRKIVGLAGWLVVVTAGIIALSAFHQRALLHDTVGLGIPLFFAALALAGAVVAVMGLSRFRPGRGGAVRIVPVIPCRAPSTPFLVCVAGLGSSLRELRIVDRAWRNMQPLLREEHPPPRTRTVAVSSASGDVVRLVEILQPGKLGAEEWGRLAEVSSAVVFLEEGGASAESLREKLHAATAVRRPEVKLRVDTTVFECDRQGLTPQGDLSLDGIRRLLIQAGRVQVDWVGILQRLWGPIADALSEKSRVGSGPVSQPPREPSEVDRPRVTG